MWLNMREKTMPTMSFLTFNNCMSVHRIREECEVVNNC